jgi:hypothetical protein
MEKITSPSEEYKQELFEAMMWTQAVECLLRNRIIEAKTLSLLNKKNTEIHSKTLGQLITILKQSNLKLKYKKINTLEIFNLAEELKKINKDRIKLAHMSFNRYFLNKLTPDPTSEIKDEIQDYKSITIAAGVIFKYLLNELDHEIKSYSNNI